MLIIHVCASILQTNGTTVCMCSVLKALTCASWERRAMLKASSSPLKELHLDLDLMGRMMKHFCMCVIQAMTGFRQVQCLHSGLQQVTQAVDLYAFAQLNALFTNQNLN